MANLIPTTRGNYAAGYLTIDTTDADADDNGLEVDDAHGGDHVEKLRLDLRGYLSLHLDVWCEDFDVDVILQVLRGYTAAGTEVWADVGVEIELTAATDDTAANVLAAMAELFSDVIRPGIYRVAAQRAGDTDPARLHVFGHAKG